MPTESRYGHPWTDPAMYPNSSSIGSLTINGSTLQAAAAFYAPTGIIDRAVLHASAAASTPSLKFSLQAWDGTNAGKPSGTPLGGGSPISKTFTPSVGSNVITFDNAYTTTPGELLMLVLDWVSGTTTCNVRAGTVNTIMPFNSTGSSGTWTVQIPAAPSIAPMMSDGFIPHGFNPVNSLSALTLTSTSGFGSAFTPTMDRVFTGASIVMRPASTTVLTAYLYEAASAATTALSSMNLRSTSASITEVPIGAVGAPQVVTFAMPSYTCLAGYTYHLFVYLTSGTTPTSFVQSLYKTSDQAQSLNADMWGTAVSSTTVTHYNSGSDYRANPVIPRFQTVTYTASPPATSWVKA